MAIGQFHIRNCWTLQKIKKRLQKLRFLLLFIFWKILSFFHFTTKSKADGKLFRENWFLILCWYRNQELDLRLHIIVLSVLVTFHISKKVKIQNLNPTCLDRLDRLIFDTFKSTKTKQTRRWAKFWSFYFSKGSMNFHELESTINFCVKMTWWHKIWGRGLKLVGWTMSRKLDHQQLFKNEASRQQIRF